MNRKTHNYQKQRQPLRGQALVEFALVLPILLLLVVGAMDFARMFSTKVTLTNAAREGANYLSRNPKDYPDTGTTEAVIASEANDLIDYSNSITCTYDCEVGDTVIVTLTREVDLIFSGFLQTFGITYSKIELSSTVEMMVQ